jgi:spermidine synthase
MTFVSPERKRSSVAGTGIQYIPGHVDPFIDVVLSHYLHPDARVLDLGGGGLRFGLPSAALKHPTTVVDLDADALNVTDIIRRVEENGKIAFDPDVIHRYLTTVCGDVFEYLGGVEESFDVVTAFRLLHFYDPMQVSKFFQSVHRHMRPGSLFIFSGTTLWSLPLKQEKNVIFNNSEPVQSEFPYYRKFADTDEARSIRQSQNLASIIHCFDIPLVQSLAKEHNFEVLMAGFPSTAIVEGYVLQRLS